MKDLIATCISKDFYRVDMYGVFVVHGVDPIMEPKREGRAVAMVDKKRLQAMYDEIGEVLAGRPAPTPHIQMANGSTITLVDTFDPEDLV